MARQHGATRHGACAKVSQPWGSSGETSCYGRFPRTTADTWTTWPANATGCATEDGLAATTTAATDSDATTSTATAAGFETRDGCAARGCDPGPAGYANARNADAAGTDGKNDVPTARSWQPTANVSPCR